jgi:MurNAc alpha-1-phosphate uridylyltransferase
MFQVVILAGGLATRLRPVTNDIPKALVEVNKRPFVDWQLELLARNKISSVLFCVSYKSELIENYVGDGSKYGLKIKYSSDGDKRLGTGGAIRKALNVLEDNFIVLYGDSYLEVDYEKAQQAFLDSGKPVMMSVFRNQGKFDASNIKFTNLRIEEYKKGNSNPQFEHIDYGLSFFKKEVFIKKNFGTRFELSEMFTELSKEGNLAGFEVFNRFYEVGSFKGIEDLTNHLRGESNVI